MPLELRRLSPSEAAGHAKAIALAYARDNGREGTLQSVSPELSEKETRGKIPVHWAVVFDNVHRGKALDGPVAFRLNLETGHVVPA